MRPQTSTSGSDNSTTSSSTTSSSSEYETEEEDDGFIVRSGTGEDTPTHGNQPIYSDISDCEPTIPERLPPSQLPSPSYISSVTEMDIDTDILMHSSDSTDKNN